MVLAESGTNRRMQSIGTRIQEIIEDLSRDPDSGVYNQATLAAALGIDKSAVNKWISGATTNIKGENLAKLETKFGYCLLWVLTGQGPKTVRQRNAEAAEKEIKSKEQAGEIVSLAGLDRKVADNFAAALYALKESISMKKAQ